MIKQYKDSKTFLNICDKLKEVKNTEFTESTLYNYMIAGVYNEKILTFASFDNDKMNGCLVLSFADIGSGLCLNILFVWLDRHYSQLWKEYIEFVDEKAKEFKCKKIVGISRRKAKLIERKLGKYGYKKIYNVFAKDVV